MKLTIITINLNNRNGLEKTINSVLRQSFFNQIEYVVIDGASTDGSVDLLCTYNKELTVVCEPDKGIYNAMNKGIRLATGDYFLFLNSGDVLYDSNVIEDIYPYLDNNLDLVIGRIIGNNNNTPSPIGHDITLRTLYESCVPHPCSFIKRDEMIKFMYDESYRICSDWKFFIQSIIQDNCSYKWVDRVVVLFDESGISNTNDKLGKAERKAILNELFPQRVLTDYYALNGYGNNTDYDTFFVEFRPYRCGKLMYSFCVATMRFFSLFLSTAKLARRYPVVIKDKHTK